MNRLRWVGSTSASNSSLRCRGKSLHDVVAALQVARGGWHVVGAGRCANHGLGLRIRAVRRWGRGALEMPISARGGHER